MFLEKLKWAYRILRSESYVILTDDIAVCSIPMVDINVMSNSFLLSAQTAALNEFRDRLQDLIDEHQEAITLLVRQSKKK